MAEPNLMLARVTIRAEYSPKSILIHSRGPELASHFYPKPFPSWRHGGKGETMHDPQRRLRAVVYGELLEVLGEPPTREADAVNGFSEMLARYERTVGANSAVSRLNLFHVYLGEGEGFEELFPEFRAVALGSTPWLQPSGYKVRDLGFTHVYYGKKSDGVDLSIGVYTPEQVEGFFSEVSEFDTMETPPKLARGALMILLRRHSEKNIDTITKNNRILERWSRELGQLATALANQSLGRSDS